MRTSSAGRRHSGFRCPSWCRTRWPVFQFSSASYSVAETAAGVDFSVTRVGGSLGPVSVGYSTVAGTATPGADYVTALGTLNWANGDATPRTFAVLLNDDSDVEGDETFSVALSNVTGGAVLGLVSTTITKNFS